MTNEITTIIAESTLAPTLVEQLQTSFNGFFEEAKAFESEAKTIVVYDILDKTGMAKARELRLKIAKVRCNAENTRKDVKEGYLRAGKTIDAIANIIKGVTVPIEEYLENQEKFAEIQEKKMKEERMGKRTAELQPYTDQLFGVADMPEEVYTEYFANAKAGYEARIKAEQQAEADRVVQAEKDRKEREEMQKENERLRAENAEKEKQAVEDKRIADEKLKAAAKEAEDARIAAAKVAEEEKEKAAQKAKEDAQKAQKEKEDAEKAQKEKMLDSVVDTIIACNGDRDKIKVIIRNFM